MERQQQLRLLQEDAEFDRKLSITRKTFDQVGVEINDPFTVKWFLEVEKGRSLHLAFQGLLSHLELLNRREELVNLHGSWRNAEHQKFLSQRLSYLLDHPNTTEWGARPRSWECRSCGELIFSATIAISHRCNLDDVKTIKKLNYDTCRAIEPILYPHDLLNCTSISQKIREGAVSAANLMRVPVLNFLVDSKGMAFAHVPFHIDPAPLEGKVIYCPRDSTGDTHLNRIMAYDVALSCMIDGDSSRPSFEANLQSNSGPSSTCNTQKIWCNDFIRNFYTALPDRPRFLFCAGCGLIIFGPTSKAFAHLRKHDGCAAANEAGTPKISVFPFNHLFDLPFTVARSVIYHNYSRRLEDVPSDSALLVEERRLLLPFVGESNTAQQGSLTLTNRFSGPEPYTSWWTRPQKTAQRNKVSRRMTSPEDEAGVTF